MPCRRALAAFWRGARSGDLCQCTGAPWPENTDKSIWNFHGPAKPSILRKCEGGTKPGVSAIRVSGLRQGSVAGTLLCLEGQGVTQKPTHCSWMRTVLGSRVCLC